MIVIVATHGTVSRPSSDQRCSGRLLLHTASALTELIHAETSHHVSLFMASRDRQPTLFPEWSSLARLPARNKFLCRTAVAEHCSSIDWSSIETTPSQQSKMESAEHESAGVVSATSMLRTIGKIGGPSGRGLIMFRTMAVASTSAAIVGLFGAFAGGTFIALSEELYIAY